MKLSTSQIVVLHWFYHSHVRGDKATYQGSIEHFGQTLKIHEPMDVIMSLLQMGFIEIVKNKMEVNITKAGIAEYEKIKDRRK